MQRIAAVFVGFILLFFLLIVGTAIFTYPGLIQVSQAADAQWIEVQTQYKQRITLIRDLMNLMESKAAIDVVHEAFMAGPCAAVEKVKMETDQVSSDPAELANYEAAQAQITENLPKLVALSENSPGLKENKDFIALQEQLAVNEKVLLVARQKFNEDIRIYNARISSFPTKLITMTLGFPPKPTFKNETP